MVTVNGIVLEKVGGPEVLSYQEYTLSPPKAGEVRIRHHAIGLNYIDVYHRTGLYPVTLPSGIGLEAAGIVEDIGPDVDGLTIGDRVAYGTGPLGAYSDAANVPAGQVVKLPDEISFETAAAMMLQGMTAYYLVRKTYDVRPGDTILIHAAAGGVGLLVCQWANHLGARVIGTVGSEAKADLAAAHGCHHPILYREEDFAQSVKDLTDGEGVSVVYDSIGAETVMKSLDCLRRRGILVSFGNASGPPPAIDIGALGPKGSLFITRPTLFHYVAEREELEQASSELFNVVSQNVVKVEVNQSYPLKRASAAHGDLEARKTTGSTILLP